MKKTLSTEKGIIQLLKPNAMPKTFSPTLSCYSRISKQIWSYYIFPFLRLMKKNEKIIKPHAIGALYQSSARSTKGKRAERGSSPIFRNLFRLNSKVISGGLCRVPAKCSPRAELPVEAYLPGAPVHLVTTEFLRYSQGDFVSAHYELSSLFQAGKIQPQIPIKYLPNKTELRYKLALSKLTLRTHPEWQ